MDAIESGIVKVPRTPVDDDADRRRSSPTCACGTTSATQLPKRSREGHGRRTGSRPRSSRARCAASTAATRRRSSTGRRELAPHGETPPVFIVVCPNTVVSKLVYDWIAGERGRRGRRGRSPTSPATSRCFSNVVDGSRLARPRTILIDSAQLESGEAHEGRLQEGRRRGDRGLQGRSTGSATPAPTSTRSPTRTCCAR